MIKLIKLLLIISVVVSANSFSMAQTISQKVMPSSGGNYLLGGYSLAWTVGEPFGKTLNGSSTMITQGFQQPYILLRILNLKTYIAGYYIGAGKMKAVLYNTGMSTDSTACDSITVELRKNTFPYALITTASGLLHTDGSASVLFPSAFLNNPYYLIIRSRNTLETWRNSAVFYNSYSMSLDLTKP